MKNEPKFRFSNIVVSVNNNLEGCIGCIVKSWYDDTKESYTYEVYVRSMNGTYEFPEKELRHLAVSKEILPEEAELYGIEEDTKGEV